MMEWLMLIVCVELGNFFHIMYSFDLLAFTENVVSKVTKDINIIIEHNLLVDFLLS